MSASRFCPSWHWSDSRNVMAQLRHAISRRGLATRLSPSLARFACQQPRASPTTYPLAMLDIARTIQTRTVLNIRQGASISAWNRPRIQHPQTRQLLWQVRCAQRGHCSLEPCMFQSRKRRVDQSLIVKDF